ncbi:MAG TPA: FtsQ-type POTRA domain-containing protein [Candidatus Polarisedimenticolia bacterium]|nr:FtsQ-type POTRA domain-containing protein [Candidatus Polarisedimenticolia bacterium]
MALKDTRSAAMPTYGDEPVSPFLRRSQEERLRGSRRRRHTLRLLPLLGVAATLLLLAAAGFGLRFWLTHSPRFSIQRIAFTATGHAAAADLKRVADRVRGKNIFRADLDTLARDLGQVRWVKRAVVKRVLPDRLFCAVEERDPQGLALVKGRVSLIDGDGRPIDLYTADKGAMSKPIFTSLDTEHPDRARVQAARGYDLLDWLEKTHPRLLSEISEIDLGRDDRLVLTMNDGGPPVRLNPDDYGANLDAWLEMRDWLAGHFGGGQYVDLRFRDRIAFRPTPVSKD